ncbi:uncharacterized protein VNE69_05062 [Vairimorpha necatrix]|uniref:Uncharacterized protein n=1 Tax=Vairimorpha necatrix TaxID=6039 RepID=A0AAX4JC50_9MICR
MRNQLNTQIDALKASNERLEQRIDMILTAKRGECEEPITIKADQEFLDLAIKGKSLKDYKYKIVVAYGFPRGEHIIRNIPLVKDIEGEGRGFLIRDEFCFQAAETSGSSSKKARVLFAENEVGDYISRNKSSLTKIFSDLRQNWKKYVPVDKAIKVIKRGLSDNSTVSHEEFFLSELNAKQLGKDMKVNSKLHNEQ